MTTEPGTPRLRELVRGGDAYRFLLAEADLGVLVIAEAIEDCNEAACRLFARSREGLIGLDPLELSPASQPDGSDSAAAATRRMQSALGGLAQWFEWRFVDARREPVHTLVHVEAVLIDGRRRVLLRLRDVSHLQRAESKLRDTEMRLQQILDNSTNALLYAKDRSGRYLFVNRGFERLVGKPADEIIGKTPTDLFAPALAARLMRNDRRAIDERRGIEVEEQVDVGGELRTEISNKFPLLDHDGVPYAVCGISVDITRRTHVEQAMRRAALAVSAVEGEELFADLVATLAQILSVEIAFIALPSPADSGKLRMLAFSVDGRMVQNFEYALAGTPCESVLGQQYRIYPARLTERFPLDDEFRRLGVEAYAGYPLTGAQGKPLGLISVVARRPLADPDLVEAMLKIFAARAVTEIERRRADEALRASEEQYRAIFNASADALVLWDSQFRRVDVNPAYERLYGWARDEVIGRAYEHPAFTPEYARPRLELVRRALAGETCHAELEAIRKNGERVPTEVHAIPFQHRGEPHVLTIARDITERKRAEQALRGSEEQYRAIFNASADALMLWNSQLKRVDVNPAHEKIFGFKREEVIGRGFEGLNYPEELVRPRIEMVRRALAGEASRADLEGLRKDGQRIVTELRAIPILHQGEPHVLQIARDVTERQRAEEALRASEAQYRAIFNASADALVLWDSQFRRVDVNPAYERLYGWTREEVIGRGYELPEYSAEYRRPREELVRRALAGETARAELVAKRKNGELVETEVVAIPFRHRGEPHVLAIVRDITQRKRAESERHVLEAQLRQAQKMEAIGHLTGGIAHDFNNILTGILGYVVLAGERDVAAADPKLRQYLDGAQRASLRARDLIQQMLTFSRGRRGEPRALDLARAAREALKLIGATLPSSMVIDVDLEARLPAVVADPVQVEQVLLNLLINARDAMRGTGAVTVRAGMDEDASTVCASCRKPIQGRFVSLSVSDSGSGIEPETLDRIFDPFFTTKGVGQGSGMGLSMVHGIVHEYGGHIMVDSTPGGGATFRILLPAHDEVHAEAATGSAASDGAPGAPPLSGRILVVDDETSVGEVMAELLASRGLEVTVKCDPLEAMRWFDEKPDRVDVVLTDQTMPRMTGLELASRLTRERPTLPVLLYTGYGDDIGPGELRRHGVAALLRKPVEPAALVEALRSHLPAP